MAKAEKNTAAVEELAGDSSIITMLPALQHIKLHDSIKHMDLCGYGLIGLPNGNATYGLTEFKLFDGVPMKMAGKDFELPSVGRYIVVAELYASAGSTLTEGKRQLVPMGYGLLDSNGVLHKITVADIPEYFDKIDGVTQKSTAAKLKTRLEPVNPCNRLYLELARYKDSLKAGYRREHTEDDATMPEAQRQLAKTGIIKLIRAQELTPEYVASLTDGDLATIALKLSRKYLGGALPLMRVRWDSGQTYTTDLGHVEVYASTGTAHNNALIPTVIEECVTEERTTVYLNRRRCILDAKNFYNILLHLMIHALGLPSNHYHMFEKIAGQCNAYYKELKIPVQHNFTEDDVIYCCPVCAAKMQYTTHRGSKTATAACPDGHISLSIVLDDTSE